MLHCTCHCTNNWVATLAMREVVKPGTMEMEMEIHSSLSLAVAAVVARSASALEVAVPFEFCYHSV